MFPIIRPHMLHSTHGMRPTGSTGAHAHMARGLLAIVPPDFTNEVIERFIDVDTLFRRGLNEAASKVLCQFSTLVAADLSLVL